MTSLSRAFAVYRLHLRILKANTVAYVLMGIVIPLASYQILAGSQPPEARLRLLLGHVVFAALLLGPRQGMNLVRLRMFGQGKLLEAFGVGNGTAVAANALYILSMVPFPLAVCAIGVSASHLAGPASFAWVLPLLLTFAALAGIAYVISGTSQSPAAATMKSNMVVMASLAFCPLFYPLARVPEAIRPFIGALPQTLCTEAMTAAWRGEPGATGATAALAAWAIGLLALGFWAESRKHATAPQ